jgi:Rrf2 family protein
MEAALAIARQPADEPVRAADLADRLSIPANYLAKILKSLARAGILLSGRGPTGGFRLARDPSGITVEDIIGRFEDVGTSRRCFLGRGRCSDANSCPMHDVWKRVSRPMFDFFHETTLADLLSAQRHRATRRKQPAGRAKKSTPRAPAKRKPRRA